MNQKESKTAQRWQGRAGQQSSEKGRERGEKKGGEVSRADPILEVGGPANDGGVDVAGLADVNTLEEGGALDPGALADADPWPYHDVWP